MEMILILGFGALIIFFMMNSRKKQKQQQEKLSTGLVPGARVMTTFGVFGTVIDVLPEENKVTIESGPGTVLTVHRQAIGQIEAPAEDLPLDDNLAGAQVPDDLSSLTPEDTGDSLTDRSADRTEATGTSNADRTFPVEDRETTAEDTDAEAPGTEATDGTDAADDSDADGPARDDR